MLSCFNLEFRTQHIQKLLLRDPVTYLRLIWNSTCFSAGVQTLNDDSLCDIIEWYTSLGIIKNKLLFFLPEMYSPYSCNLNLYWVGKILSHLPDLCGCDWQNGLKSSYITDTFHITSASTQNSGVTQKMEAVCSSEMSKHLPTVQFKNPKEHSHLWTTTVETWKPILEFIVCSLWSVVKSDEI
jgi:hypothetical protein